MTKLTVAVLIHRDDLELNEPDHAVTTHVFKGHLVDGEMLARVAQELTTDDDEWSEDDVVSFYHVIMNHHTLAL